MREVRIHQIILMLLLLLSVVGCAGIQKPDKPDIGAKETQPPTSGDQRPRSEQSLKAHVVRGRFEPGPADGELTFIFDVSPIPEALPRARWVGASGNDARTLTVQSDKSGRYSARLADVPKVSDGQVLIELSHPESQSLEIHGAEFALREHIVDRPASRPSRDGHLVVFTKPEGVSPELRLLIGSSRQPLESLPNGVTHSAVVGVYTLDFLPTANPDGWLLTIAAPPSDARPVLFYLAKGDAAWRVLETKVIEGQPLLSANFLGAGTYMLVREVTR